MNQIEPHVTWMIRRDMQEVLEIERQCFDHPWSEEDLVRCLRQRNCIGMCAHAEAREGLDCKESELLGYMIYELHKKQLNILNFAVRPSLYRNGVGAAMVGKLKSKLTLERRNRIMLMIPEANINACLFFRQMGFMATGTLRDFYEETDGDAYVFEFIHSELNANNWWHGSQAIDVTD